MLELGFEGWIQVPQVTRGSSWQNDNDTQKFSSYILLGPCQARGQGLCPRALWEQRRNMVTKQDFVSWLRDENPGQSSLGSQHHGAPTLFHHIQNLKKTWFLHEARDQRDTRIQWRENKTKERRPKCVTLRKDTDGDSSTPSEMKTTLEKVWEKKAPVKQSDIEELDKNWGK